MVEAERWTLQEVTALLEARRRLLFVAHEAVCSGSREIRT